MTCSTSILLSGADEADVTVNIEIIEKIEMKNNMRVFCLFFTFIILPPDRDCFCAQSQYLGRPVRTSICPGRQARPG